MAGVSILFFNQNELAKRWRLSGRTLERWRYEKRGPSWIRAGGRVLYRVTDIEEFERQGLQITEVRP